MSDWKWMERARTLALRGAAVAVLAVGAGPLAGCEELLDDTADEDDGGNGNGDGDGNGNGNGDGPSASCGEDGSLPLDISEDLTIGPDDCNFVDGVMSVTAELTIEPGVTLRFASNSGIAVNTDGALVAVGTADEPIVLTADQDTPGFWRGVAISSNDVRNTLDYVTISYGGGQRWGGSSAEAGLYVFSTGRVSIDNSTFDNSSTYGVWLEEDVSLESFSSNTMGDNANAPLALSADNVSVIDATSTFAPEGEPNGEAFVRVNAETVETSGTWSALDVPYRLNGTSNVGAETDLTIAAGAILEFAASAGLTVYDGQLSSEGSADAPVVMTGAEPTPGFWRGVAFSSNRAGNLLRYTEVAYGGGDRYGGTATEPNIYVFADGLLTIENSVIHDSGNEGLYVEEGANLEAVTDSAFYNNADGGVSVPSSLVHVLDPSNTFAAADGFDNPNPWVTVRGDEVFEKVTWKHLDLPYRFYGVANINDGGEVTVEEATELEFADAAGISVNSGGAFAAVGTADEPIVFRGADSASGYWRGLAFSSNRSANQLDHVEITDGGGERYGGSSAEANLYIFGDARLGIANTTLSNSADFGLYAEASANVFEAGTDDALTTLEDYANAGVVATGNSSGDIFLAD